MDDFTEMVTRRLGVAEATARVATAGLLGFVREQVAAKDFGDLLSAMPGSADLMGETPLEPRIHDATRRGGLWDTMAGKALTAVGADRMGSGMELAGRLKHLGLTGSQVASLISMFRQYARARAGNGLFWRITNQVPDLRRAVGRSRLTESFKSSNSKEGERDELQDRRDRRYRTELP